MFSKPVIVLILLASVFSRHCDKHDLSVYPNEPVSGQTVRITTKQPFFASDKVTIEVGKKTVDLLLENSPTEITALIPPVSPGYRSVIVREKASGNVLARGFVHILPARTLYLALFFDSDKISLQQYRPVSGEYVSRTQQSQRRLSYDVINKAGGLVFTGAVDHPLFGRREVFDQATGESFIQDGKSLKVGSFSIKIPNIEEEARIRFYDAPANLDVNTEAGRVERKFLNEIKVDKKN